MQGLCILANAPLLIGGAAAFAGPVSREESARPSAFAGLLGRMHRAFYGNKSLHLS
jgi:hypothetical protein